MSRALMSSRAATATSCSLSTRMRWMSIESVRFNIGENRGREQTGKFDRFCIAAGDGRAYRRRRNRLWRDGLKVDGAGDSRAQAPRIVDSARAPLRLE